jgi:hypothetical protein
MPTPARRPFLQMSLAGLATLAAPPIALGRAGVKPRAESPLVGVDPAFVESGLTARWQAAMRQDLGWSAQWAKMGTADVLAQLESGQIDAGLFLSHPKADALDKQGLIYNRHSVARTEVLLLGPVQDLAGIRSEPDAGRALSQVLAAAAAGAARWEAPPEGSPLAALAERLTHGLSKGQAPPPGAKAAPAGAAYRLVTRAQWRQAKPGDGPLKTWLAGGPLFQLEAQVACSFHARHPGAKLLVSWLQWPLAQGAVKASRPAWQSVKG